MLKEKNLDITDTPLIFNSYGDDYTYFLTMLKLNGCGTYSHNKVAKIVQKGDYEYFAIRFIYGLKHQAFHMGLDDDVISDQVICDISDFIHTFFKEYSEQHEITCETSGRILAEFNIKNKTANSVTNTTRMDIISNLQLKQYEHAIASFIRYISEIINPSQTVINRIKSDMVALLNQLNEDFTDVDSLKINSLI